MYNTHSSTNFTVKKHVRSTGGYHCVQTLYSVHIV